MKKKYDAVATIGKYTNKQGEEKKRYMTVGSIFEDDQGRMSLKLDGIPCTPDWSGWISFYEPKGQSDGYSQNQHNQSKINGFQPQHGDESTIPF